MRSRNGSRSLRSASVLAGLCVMTAGCGSYEIVGQSNVRSGALVHLFIMHDSVSRFELNVSFRSGLDPDGRVRALDGPLLVNGQAVSATEVDRGEWSFSLQQPFTTQLR